MIQILSSHETFTPSNAPGPGGCGCACISNECQTSYEWLTGYSNGHCNKCLENSPD